MNNGFTPSEGDLYINLSVLDKDTLEELTELRPENKQWILQELGFTPSILREVGRWHHPLVGELYFNIHKDDLKDLIGRIIVTSTEKIRSQQKY